MSTPPIDRNGTGTGGGNGPGPLRPLRGTLGGRDRTHRFRGPRRGRRNTGDPREGTLPQPEPVESRAVREAGEYPLVRRARRDGAQAAARGVFDPWVLAAADGLPYLVALEYQRDRVRARLVVASARADEDAVQEESRLRSLVEEGTHRRARAERRRERLEVRRDTVIAQLDRLARRADRWDAFRDGLVGRYERRRRAGAPPAAGEAPEGLTGRGARSGRDVPVRPGEDPRRTDLRHADPRHPDGRRTDTWQSLADPGHDPGAGHGTAEATRAAWEGAKARPGLSPLARIALLTLLALVELPVYYVVFLRLHGNDRTGETLSVSLTLAVATVMVIAPHCAARVLRGRAATGAIKLSALPALGILAAWGYGAWMLGLLRAKLIFAPPETRTTNGRTYTPKNSVDALELSQTSVSAMFIALLLLSGGIAFLIGLGDEHPYLGSYRHVVTRLDAAEREIADAQRDIERASAALNSLAERRAERRRAQEARLHAVGGLYESAAASYLNGVALGARDPAVTEAATRLARRWPLLAEAPVPVRV